MACRSVYVLASCCLLLPSARAADEKEVRVAQPIERTVTDHADYTGRTDAAQTVEVRARVTGYLLRAPFREGGEVKKGDLLFEIDPRPYKALVDKAQAEVAVARATQKEAKSEYERFKAINSKDSRTVTSTDLEKAETRMLRAEAELKAAEANLEMQKLNLDFTQVRAPIDGRIGRRAVDVGNLVEADKTTLATIVSQDPMCVYFDMDEVGLLRWRRALDDAGVTDKSKLPVFMGLAREDGYPHEGTIDSVDNRIDPKTGTLRVRAVFANPEPARGRRLLLPGMFVRVRLPMGKPYKALLVNRLAVWSVDGKDVVFVVNEKNKVEMRPVKLGPVFDELRVVTDGVKPGDWVVVARASAVDVGEVVKPRRVAMPEGAKGEEGAKPKP